MDFDSNSHRLKHIKDGESVFEALLQLGGKASFPEVVEKIAKSISQPEHIIKSDVKQVLRTSVMNGYLVRHGKDYLLSRSCRTWYTCDSAKRSSPSSEKKKEDVGTTASTTFGFPFWWNRFWNRYVSFKGKDQSCSSLSSAERQLDDNEPINATSTDKGVSISSIQTDHQKNTLLMTECSVPSNEFSGNSASIMLQETEADQEANETESISKMPITKPACNVSSESFATDGGPKSKCRKLKLNSSNDSIAPGNDLNFYWINDEFKEENWMD